MTYNKQRATPKQMIEWIEAQMGIEQGKGPFTDRTALDDERFYRLKSIRDFIKQHSEHNADNHSIDNMAYIASCRGMNE